MTAAQNRSDPPGPNPDTPGPGGGPGRSDTRAKVPRSRMGGAWVVLLVAALVLALLLVFILQNGQRAEVSFLGAHGHLPMGVALLLAAVFGILLVALPGTARIIQLRMLSRRRHNGAERRPSSPAAAPDDPAGTSR
ncbi:MAG TPA: lipopolysaccharide assembly protein LapA domain-containing protein [Micromonosporaceae bacterium]|jgi:uncharacterized integral membrane protein